MTRRLLLLAAPLPAQTTKVPDRGPQIPPEMVKEFVIAGHAKLDKTKEMLALQPGLLNACWDWGGGDFETALGGASHMGNREIAEFLIGQGARVDLFAAAMLGKIEIVQAALTAFPGIAKALGPHKIPLIAHALKGGPQAEAVVRLLQGVQA